MTRAENRDVIISWLKTNVNDVFVIFGARKTTSKTHNMATMCLGSIHCAYLDVALIMRSRAWT